MTGNKLKLSPLQTEQRAVHLEHNIYVYMYITSSTIFGAHEPVIKDTVRHLGVLQGSCLTMTSLHPPPSGSDILFKTTIYNSQITPTLNRIHVAFQHTQESFKKYPICASNFYFHLYRTCANYAHSITFTIENKYTRFYFKVLRLFKIECVSDSDESCYTCWT